MAYICPFRAKMHPSLILSLVNTGLPHKAVWQIAWAPSLGTQEPRAGAGQMLNLDEASPVVLQAALAAIFVKHWGG